MRESNLSLNKQAYQQIYESAGDGIIIIDLETGRVIDANPAACSMHHCPREDFIGQDLELFIHPKSQPKLKVYLRSAQAETKFSALVKHTCRDGNTFDAEWHGTVFTDNDRPCFLGIVRDVSNRIQAEQQLKKQMKTRTHEHETLLAISHTLASTLELQPGLILDQLREIIEYSHGGLFMVEDASLYTLAMRGSPELAELAPVRIHLQGPEVMSILFSGTRPVRIADMWSDSTQAQVLRSLLENGGSILLDGMLSWMWVPLAVKNRIIGGIGVGHNKTNHFTAHDAELALSVANQAAITLVNAELHEQAQDLAALEERQRLARNLHDAINQSLFSAGIIAEVLPNLWERDQELARQSLQDLRKLTLSAQAEMRALLAELRPSTVIDSNLDDLLTLLGNALAGRIGISVDVIADHAILLPSSVQVAFYRVCQEALNNIVKHANPGKVEIILKEELPEIEMRIRDDGNGFNLDETAPDHYGLKMMRERAEAVDARLLITSQPGQGTEIVLCWTAKSPQEVR